MNRQMFRRLKSMILVNRTFLVLVLMSMAYRDGDMLMAFVWLILWLYEWAMVWSNDHE